MSRGPGRPTVSPILIVLPLAAFTAVLLWPGEWPHGAAAEASDMPASLANAREVSEPQCPREAELGRAATARLQGLLNAGAFTLEPVDRDRDRYGRLLRTVTRGGESLGEVLVREGLAEEWRGRRGSWC